MGVGRWYFLALKIISDIVIINIVFILGYIIKFKIFNPFAISIIPYFKVLMFITLLWVIVLNLAGLYKLQTDEIVRTDGIFPVSFGVFSAGFFTYIIIVFLYREALYTREIVIYASFLALIFINLSRYLVWRLYSGLKL
ncbi:MAG: hypothetical protein HQ564_03685 [Candidatus Saganbacteria bacterium]|nr:hypothetical protein [Candidatus Saganbacteria bacterium]